MNSFRSAPSVVAILCVVAGCSQDPTMPAATTDAGGADLAQPQTEDGGGGGTSYTAAMLTAFVKAGSYKSWKAEPAIHASTGPHGGNVRTFVNDKLYASLKSGATSHPKGSMVVKELYGSGTTTITGHAVDVKDDTSGVWVFYEGFAPGYTSPYYFQGTSNFCASCHAPGKDYVLTAASALP